MLLGKLSSRVGLLGVIGIIENLEKLGKHLNLLNFPKLSKLTKKIRVSKTIPVVVWNIESLFFALFVNLLCANSFVWILIAIYLFV